MKFLFDHDVATDVARVLRIRGHDVVELRDALRSDTPDSEIWRFACSEGRIVVTCNRRHFQALAAVDRGAAHAAQPVEPAGAVVRATQRQKPVAMALDQCQQQIGIGLVVLGAGGREGFAVAGARFGMDRVNRDPSALGQGVDHRSARALDGDRDGPAGEAGVQLV